MNSTIHNILQKYWGHQEFRPQQEAIIHHVLEGGDVLALLPTGGGKSVCFQVPALAMDGLCLVISPLIALMKDQVSNLRKKGITAFSIVSGMEQQEVKKTLQLASESNCRFLYVSPERLTTQLFKEYLPSLSIKLIAVDEAHCISQWGYDFRPPYLQIAAIREQVPDAPVIALTASATPEVQADICEKLQFRKEQVFQTSFSRPNLSYTVRETPVKIQELVHILQKVPGTGVVYCKSRKRTRDIAGLLQQQGISADFYHAGLTAAERAQKQEAWIGNQTRIIVCTNAFGMGIDKPDVRVVVHYDIPDALENYYQEAGRAGRDGNRAYAVLLYGNTDTDELARQPDIRYPPEATVKEVYRALVNYLQIPSDSGEGQYYDFNFPVFTERFGIANQAAMHSLKALEQDGWIQISEKTWKPAKLEFICSSAYLREVQETKPEWNEIILALLRSYEGIFDYPVSIKEKYLARLCAITEAELVKILERLHQAGVVKYVQAPETPQVFFLKNRVAVENFRLNIHKHNERKEVYRKRIEEMIRFTLERKTCRSVIIGNYFGDAAISNCGICDNCISQRKSPAPVTEISPVQHMIQLLANGGIDLHDLVNKMEASFGEALTKKTIRHLESESLITVGADGMVVLKK